MLILNPEGKDYILYALYRSELTSPCNLRHCNDNCLNV
jgi:hypothetical protein